MSDPTETARRVLDLDAKMTPSPWPEDYWYGAIRHIQRNVDADSFYSPDEGTEPWCGPARDEGTLIAQMRNAAPDLARALLESQAALAAAEEGRLAALDIAKGAYEERDEARAALAAANSRADAAERDWIDAKAGFGQQAAAWGRENDALRADLARVTECNEAMRAPMKRLRDAVNDYGSGEGTVVDKVLSDLAAARRDVEALRGVAAARCDGKGHWSHKGAPEGPGHTVRECVKWDCDECKCSDRFWTAFDAAPAPVPAPAPDLAAVRAEIEAHAFDVTTREYGAVSVVAVDNIIEVFDAALAARGT